MLLRGRYMRGKIPRSNKHMFQVHDKSNILQSRRPLITPVCAIIRAHTVQCRSPQRSPGALRYIFLYTKYISGIYLVRYATVRSISQSAYSRAIYLSIAYLPSIYLGTYNVLRGRYLRVHTIYRVDTSEYPDSIYSRSMYSEVSTLEYLLRGIYSGVHTPEYIHRSTYIGVDTSEYILRSLHSRVYTRGRYLRVDTPE
jgi:hypothetical protein